MSNPGVIKLAEITTKQHTFRVEDNIGEAIHLHFDNIRLDLSVNEYRNLVSQVRSLLENMIQLPGFKLKYIEPLFFMEMGKHWPYLYKSFFEEKYLNDILVDTYVFDEETQMEQNAFRPLSESRVVKYLQGNRSENDKRSQTNLIGQSNSERVEDMLRLMRRADYPIDDKYLVITNLSPGIYDGQHRAACMYYLYGNIKVKVLHLLFSDGLDEKGLEKLANPEKKWPSLKAFAAAHNKLYMFGAGKFANILLHEIKQEGIKIDGVMVTHPMQKEFNGLPVIFPSEVREKHEECGVIFALGQKFHAEATSLLETWGFKSFYRMEDYKIWDLLYQDKFKSNREEI